MGGEYRLTTKLENGELAELFRAARDDHQGVVVKLFHPKTSDQKYARVVADTARTLQAVFHPGISHVIEIGTVRGRLAIVREDSGRYTLGQVLQRLNTRDVVLQTSLALAFVIELLECVQQAHDVMVVHGAITPGNVLMSPQGRPSVCDFGALSALHASPALKKNFGGKGRSAYRAPELQKGEEPTVQSDIYSLGAIAYELITLREAQTGGVKTRHEPLPPPSRLDRRINSRLDAVVMRALEQVPGRRYRAPSEMASSLRDFLGGNGGMPSRDELEHFVDQLFPPDVQVDQSVGPIPFDDRFHLDEVTGAGIEEADERSMVVMDRRAFSRAADDPTAPVGHPLDETDDEPMAGEHLPVRTPVENPAALEWEAPPSSAPVARRVNQVEAPSADLLKRFKRIEDFDDSASVTQLDLPRAQPDTMRDDPPLKPPSPAPPRASPVGPSVSQQIERSAVKPSDTDEIRIKEHGHERRLHTSERAIVRMLREKRRWVPLAIVSALLALVMFILAYSKLQSAEVVLPEVTPSRAPKPIPRPAPRRDVTPDKPKGDAVVEKPAPVAPAKDCYQPGKKATGFLSVASARELRIFVDGDRICGSLVKVPVMPGSRKISVVDSRTKEHYDTDIRIEAGKTARLIPSFKTR